MPTDLGETTNDPLSEATIFGEVFSDNEGRVMLSNELFQKIHIPPNTRMKMLMDGDSILIKNAAVYALDKVREETKGLPKA